MYKASNKSESRYKMKMKVGQFYIFQKFSESKNS